MTNGLDLSAFFHRAMGGVDLGLLARGWNATRRGPLSVAQRAHLYSTTTIHRPISQLVSHLSRS